MFGGARFVPGPRFVTRDRVGRAVPATLKGRVGYNPNARGFQPLGQINRKRPSQTRLFSKTRLSWDGMAMGWPTFRGGVG